LKIQKPVKVSGSKRIAERYVKALFDVARSTSSLDAVEKDMRTLAKALETTPSFQHFLRNPLLSKENQAQMMTAILNNVGAHRTTQQFVALLARRRRLGALAEIMESFCQRVASERGEMRAELVAAKALTPQEIALVSERLGKAYGKKIILDVRQEPELLGGIVVNIGSLRLDGSLAGKLKRLQIGLKAA
jgi:F-type H+-transporting ATPase subunit delta